MRQVIEQLFSPTPGVSDKARQRLMGQHVRTVEDARAVVEALAREAPSPRRSMDTPHGALLALLQAPGSHAAMEYFREHAPPALIAAWPRLPENERGFALKVLALIGTRESLAFVARTLAAPDGPRDYMAPVALEAIPLETEHVDVLFPTLTAALALPDYRASAVLDLANKLVAAGRLSPHPAATRMDLLRQALDSEEDGPAPALTGVSVCYALSLMPGPEALELLEQAKEHPDPEVRLEALYGRTRLGVPGAEEELARATLDPVIALRAREYLEELGKAHLIPQGAKDPVHMAKAEMVSWLMHPNEFGEPPDSIELWDRRVLDWPPTGDRRELFLFVYSYTVWTPAEEQERGVGLVGSSTFSLTGDTQPPPEGTPEDAYVAHCLWELRQEGDPRGEELTPEEVRKLLGFAPRLLN